METPPATFNNSMAEYNKKKHATMSKVKSKKKIQYKTKKKIVIIIQALNLYIHI